MLLAFFVTFFVTCFFMLYLDSVQLSQHVHAYKTLLYPSQASLTIVIHFWVVVDSSRTYERQNGLSDQNSSVLDGKASDVT